MFLGPPGGQKNGSSNQRRHTQGRKKGDPQHKAVGKLVGSEYLRYRRVVKDGFQKTFFDSKETGKNKEKTPTITITPLPGPQGASKKKKTVPAISVDTLMQKQTQYEVAGNCR